MDKFTKQMGEWRGDFGKEYTDRNALSLQELDLLYQGYFGITRMEMNQIFVGDFDGMEYFAETYTQIEYRGHSDLLWKTDFPKLFFDCFANIKLVKKKLFKYLNNDNVDVLFLLLKEK